MDIANTFWFLSNDQQETGFAVRLLQRGSKTHNCPSLDEKAFLNHPFFYKEAAMRHNLIFSGRNSCTGIGFVSPPNFIKNVRGG